MVMSTISIQQVNFAYQKKTVLHDIQLEFQSNCFSVLLGRNGSGKSTLFNLMAGIYPLQSGQILFDGQPLAKLKGKQRAIQLGFLAQSHRSIFNFKVLDVVLTGRAAFSGYAPSQIDRDQAYEALHMLEIEHLQDRDYTTLSGGERQLVMIARILTQNPKVILLDEPTNHLDVYYQAFLMQKLHELSRRGYTIVAIMHDPNLAFLYADEFFFIKDSQIIRAQDKAQAAEADFLAQVYDLPFQQAYVGTHKIVMPRRREISE